MTAQAKPTVQTTLAPIPANVIAVAHILARARISDISEALDHWPRCGRCHRLLPVQRVLRSETSETGTRSCCRSCNKKSAKARWETKKRLREQEARAIATALEPVEPLPLPSRPSPPALTTRIVKVYHAGRDPLWTSTRISEPATTRKR